MVLGKMVSRSASSLFGHEQEKVSVKYIFGHYADPDEICDKSVLQGIVWNRASTSALSNGRE